ncbi:MAG: prepilin peptidase [Eubacteriales bacterium]|nr:prepilin peptidase [Eubacteriales bacterium]
MERWLFAGFLLLAAAQDLERKQVDIWIYLLFGGAAVAGGIGRQLAGGEACGWLEYLGGVCPGIVLLAASAVSRGGIGAGDGWFFLVSGLYLGFWENLMMLCYGTLFCGIFCLGYLVWCRFRQIQNGGKRVVPFLPFVVPPGIWLVMRGWGVG